MAFTETIKTGRKYRKCVDNTSGNKVFERYSFWGKASDVEFNDGTTAENKLGSYKGVTTNENQVAGYAADVTLVKSIKTSLTNLITSLTNLVNSINDRLGGLRFYEDSTGKYVVGADSVPKKLGSISESNVLSYYQWSVRNKSISDNDVDGYINISEFNLTQYSGYNDYKFGENIIAYPSQLLTGQHLSYLMAVPFVNQKNEIVINYDNITREMCQDWKERNIEGSDGTLNWANTFMRYNPNTGRLLVVNMTNSVVGAVTLIKF